MYYRRALEKCICYIMLSKMLYFQTTCDIFSEEFWQLCVLNGYISVAARDDAAKPRELWHTNMDYGLYTASCECCEACGCHSVGV